MRAVVSHLHTVIRNAETVRALINAKLFFNKVINIVQNICKHVRNGDRLLNLKL